MCAWRSGVYGRWSVSPTRASQPALRGPLPGGGARSAAEQAHERACSGIWNTRLLRRADAWDGTDPDEVDATFEEEFAECRARRPQFYKQDPLDRM